MSLWLQNNIIGYYKIIHTRLYDYKIIVGFFPNCNSSDIIFYNIFLLYNIYFSDIKCIFLFTIVQSMRESIKPIYIYIYIYTDAPDINMITNVYFGGGGGFQLFVFY